MTTPRKFFVLGLMLLTVSLSSIADDSRDPATIVEETTANTLQQLNERRDEFTADPTRLQALVRSELLPLIDIDYSSRLILGRASRSASPEQLNAFAEAMSNLLINRYADGLLAFQSSGQLEVMPLKGDNTEKLTRVRTRIKLENGSFAPVDFAFRKTAEGWKAFDITVEGISYVITYRNQLSPMVAERGLDQVTSDLSAGNIQLTN